MVAEGEEDENENLSSLTTLRRSAAFTVERFSKIYHNDIFIELKDPLESALKSQQIELMEPAILILGTISDPDGAYGYI